jgi:hypothetical protein
MKGKIGLAAIVLLLGILASSLVMGGPVKYSCSDTDGGNYPLVYGTVSGYYNKVWYSYSDYCVNAGNIMEYYCNGVYRTSQQQSCGTDGYVGSNYCSSEDVYKDWRDYACASGACGYTDTPTIQQDCVSGQYCSAGACYWNNTCSDTDGGFVWVVQGTTSGYYNGNPYSNTDYCVNPYAVLEYYCASGIQYANTFNCTGNYTGCSNGACV